MTHEQDRRKAETRKEIRLWGAPTPESFVETNVGKALSEAAQIHYTDKEDQDRLLAIEKLALDILHDPAAARAFTVNPEEYMRRFGLNVKIDLNSPQIRMVMAVGDPDVREAARRADIFGFLDAIKAQGIDIPIPTRDQVAAVFPVEVLAMVSAAITSFAAVAFHVAAVVQAAVETGWAVHHAAYAYTRVSGPAKPLPALEALLFSEHDKLMSKLAERYGGEEFAKEVKSERMKQIIMAYVKLEIKEIEETKRKIDEYAVSQGEQLESTS